MIIASGIYKNKNITCPKEIRPTKAIVKNALFNIISNMINYPYIFIDICCGSGSVGIEALSRGAKYAIFIDNNTHSIQALSINLAKIAPDKYAFINLDVYKNPIIIDIMPNIIFIDPPYEFTNIEQIVAINNKIINSKTIIITETHRSYRPCISGLELFRDKVYGISCISFFKKNKINNINH